MYFNYIKHAVGLVFYKLRGAFFYKLQKAERVIFEEMDKNCGWDYFFMKFESEQDQTFLY